MFILSNKMYSEFLAVPQLVRFEVPGNQNPIPTLLIKSTTLALKYLVQTGNFVILISSVADTGAVLYAVKIDDDPINPSILWSIAETENELTALRLFLKDKKCDVFLFNEGAINVCGTTGVFRINDLPRGQADILKAVPPQRTEAIEISEIVRATLEKLHKGDATKCELISRCTWRPFKNDYLSSQMGPSQLDLINGEEGQQQEILGLWLTDALSVEGATLSPRVFEGAKSRELTDILFGYKGGCFFVESKALSIFERSVLPDRAKLKKSTLKNIFKAVSQLSGACRSIRRGLKVTNATGDEIWINRSSPVHCMLLVPDLSLLDESDGLGGDFVRDFLRDNNAYLHILDPSALLRSVQHALMLSKNSESGLSVIVTFDAALMMRWQTARKHSSPDIEFIIRIK